MQILGHSALLKVPGSGPVGSPLCFWSRLGLRARRWDTCAHRKRSRWGVVRGTGNRYFSSPDPDDFFLEDPHDFDSDDYDPCVLGADADYPTKEEQELADACLGGVESSCRILFSESRRAGKNLVKTTGNTVGGGLKVAMEQLPQAGKKSANVIKNVARKVVGEENVSKIKKSVNDIPEGWWARFWWLWEQPFVKLGRVTVFFARLPAVWALALTQFGFIAGQLSLPMLPPLLLGAGMLMRSVWVNANYIFPRIYIIAILLYITWFGNSVVQKIVSHLKRKGTVDAGLATTITNWVECTAILIAGVIILSMLGVNISGLFLPAGICLALASKDLAHNFVAGIFLFLVQPFRTGDEVTVQSSVPVGGSGSWMEGICEKIDLRYTVLRKGSHRLFIPNKSFMTKEFMVLGNTDLHERGLDDTHIWDNMPGTRIAQDQKSTENGERYPVVSNSVPSPGHPPSYSSAHRGHQSTVGNPTELVHPFVHNQIQSTWAPADKSKSSASVDSLDESSRRCSEKDLGPQTPYSEDKLISEQKQKGL